MGTANILLIVFLIALAVLSLWWAFNTIHQIQLQKEYAAVVLTSVAKLWKKTQYVPEDARDRESLYLYRDFLAKFDEDGQTQFPLLVKDGNVRCMTRREYDRACNLPDKRPFSVLLLVTAVVYAICAVAFNLRNLWFGLMLAAVMPVWLVVLGIFVNRFNQDKNNYRGQLFAVLQDNCADFLRLTKPYIMVDAYPQKFGKNARPRYVAMGEISAEQITDTKNYVIRQKTAETEIITRSAAKQDEIDRLQGKTPKATVTTTVAPAVPETPVTPAPATVNPRFTLAEKEKLLTKLVHDAATAQKQAQAAANPVPTLSAEKKYALLCKLVHDSVTAEQAQAVQAASLADTPPETIHELPPVAPLTATTAPDENDFSLDSIGLALDAELAKRRKRA